MSVLSHIPAGGQAGAGGEAGPSGCTMVAMTADIVALSHALAHPKRLALFRSLRLKERCVADLVAGHGLSQPLVSHHLGVLMRAGLVNARRSDGFTMYALDEEGLRAAQVAMEGLLDPDQLAPTARPGGNSDCCRS